MQTKKTKTHSVTFASPLDLPREDLQDEQHRFPMDCTLLGSVENVIHEIEKRQQCTCTFVVKRRKTDSDVVRHYHVFVANLKTFELEDEERFHTVPILYAHPVIHTHILCSLPNVGVCMEIVLQAGPTTHKPLSPLELNELCTSMGVLHKIDLTPPNYKKHTPTIKPVDLLTDEHVEPLLPTTPLLPSTTPALSSGITGWVSSLCSRFAGPPPTPASDAPTKNPEEWTPIVPSTEQPIPWVDRPNMKKHFPRGLPLNMSMGHVAKRDMHLKDQEIHDRFQTLMRNLLGKHNPDPLYVDCGQFGKHYYAMYAYGFETLQIQHMRVFPAAESVRVTHVSVDNKSKCLVVTWLKCTEPVECYWQSNTRQEEIRTLGQQQQQSPLVPLISSDTAKQLTVPSAMFLAPTRRPKPEDKVQKKDELVTSPYFPSVTPKKDMDLSIFFPGSSAAPSLLDKIDEFLLWTEEPEKKTSLQAPLSPADEQKVKNVNRVMQVNLEAAMADVPMKPIFSLPATPALPLITSPRVQIPVVTPHSKPHSSPAPFVEPHTSVMSPDDDDSSEEHEARHRQRLERMKKKKKKKISRVTKPETKLTKVSSRLSTLPRYSSSSTTPASCVPPISSLASHTIMKPETMKNISFTQPSSSAMNKTVDTKASPLEPSRPRSGARSTTPRPKSVVRSSAMTRKRKESIPKQESKRPKSPMSHKKTKISDLRTGKREQREMMATHPNTQPSRNTTGTTSTPKRSRITEAPVWLAP